MNTKQIIRFLHLRNVVKKIYFPIQKIMSKIRSALREDDQSNSFFLPYLEEEDPVYRNVRDGNGAPDVEWRRNVEELWRNFRPYANSKFREDIQEKFYPFWWEMFLGSTFLENGFKLDKTKIKQPDVCIKDGQRHIWVEAAMPQRGEGVDCVPERQTLRETGGMASYMPNEKIILRYTNAIYDKSKQFQNRLENGICKETDPYIIAIHSYYLNDNRNFVGIPLIAKAVYPVGDLYATFSHNPSETETDYGYREKISKENQVDIQTSIFLNEEVDDYKGISGVLFSHKTPCHYSLVEKDFVFVHNYLAKNPIPLGSFKFAVEYFIEEKEDFWELKPYEGNV